MGLPLERLAREATLLDTPTKRISSDIHDLMHFQKQFWRKQLRELRESSDPTMLQGGFAGMPVNPPAEVLATVTSTNGTTALWTSSLYTPMAAGVIQTPSGWRLMAAGKSTDSTSPGNLGFDPRVGAGSTGGSAVSGTTLGASTNVALTASITASFWKVLGDITVRKIGASGANSVISGFFVYVGTQATSGGLAGPAVVGAGHQLMFGGTNASVDLSVASGFSLGVVHTVTTITYATEDLHWVSWD